MRMRYTLALAAASMLIFGTTGVALANTGFSANLNGLNEVPANASPATGYGFCVLDNAGANLSYSVTYSGLVAPRTASHFHGPATTAQNAAVVFAIAGAGPTADVITGSWAIDATNLTRLQSGLLYFNVHSTTFGGGEIRGQILPDATPTRGTTWGRIKAMYAGK